MIILGTNSIEDTGFDVANSCRFNSGSSDFLGANQFSNTAFDSTKKFTLSVWVKKTSNGVNNSIFGAESNVGSDGKTTQFYFDTSDQLRFYDNFNNVSDVKTNRVFRDNSAFYNIILAVDYTQSTNSNRVKIIVNGEQETSLATSTYANQNDNITALQQNRGIILGVNENSGGTKYGYFNGYMSEFVFLDGIAADQTSFGEFDEDSGIWKPIDVSGLTFGTNGFYLDFENSGALGADVSGNTNNFTVNNLTAIDQSTDTCTTNFATMNPLAPANISSASEGNLKILQSSSGGSVISTFGFSSGKWYWEVELDSQVNYTQLAGVIKESKMESALLTSFNVGANDGGWGYFLQGNSDNGKAFHNNTASSAYTTMSAGNILSIAVDSDNGKIFFAVNGTYVNSGNPANGTGAVYTNLPTGENLFPAITNYVGDGSTATLLMNFGSPPYSESGGETDGNGYGNFAHAVPSGYYSLNTKNLAEYG